VTSFRAERAVSPLDGSELWVVLDSGFVMHREASDFLRALHGAGRSPQTIRVYAGRVARFLGWCADQGVEWSSISLPALARFKHFVEATPHRDGRLRSGATVNVILTAVCEFLRFCARTGVIEQAVADRLSEPRWLRFTPPGFDAGESGQFRTVRARALKARAETAFPEAFTVEQAERVVACCRRPRERFMVALLRDGGLRIGEALGLRRCDLHLLPDSRRVGCAVLVLTFTCGTGPIPMARWRSRGLLAPCRRARRCCRHTRTISSNARRSSATTTVTWCSSTSTTNRWARR
jgi:integrase/recombinase XerD